MADDEVQCGFALDNGGYLTRVSFSGDSSPRGVFPTVVGRLRNQVIGEEMGNPDFCVGDAVNALYNKSYPLTRGIVNNWDDMTSIWHHAFYDQLKMNVYETFTIMTESVLNTSKNREKATEIMLEYFTSPAFFMHHSAMYAFLLTGKTAGIVVESGYDTTTVVPIFQGKVLKHAVQSMEIGGQDLTLYLAKLLAAKGKEEFDGPLGHVLVDNIKYQGLYVALDPDQPGTEPYNYQRADGNGEIVITEERHKCPEALFQPSLLGLECDGIAQMVANAINKLEPEMQPKMWKNIMLVGGNTLIPGLEVRLEKELTALAPKGTQVHIMADADRKYSVFQGASMLAGMNHFQKYWIVKEEYDEYGPAICEKRQNEFTLA